MSRIIYKVCNEVIILLIFPFVTTFLVVELVLTIIALAFEAVTHRKYSLTRILDSVPDITDLDRFIVDKLFCKQLKKECETNDLELNISLNGTYATYRGINLYQKSYGAIYHDKNVETLKQITDILLKHNILTDEFFNNSSETFCLSNHISVPKYSTALKGAEKLAGLFENHGKQLAELLKTTKNLPYLDEDSEYTQIKLDGEVYLIVTSYEYIQTETTIYPVTKKEVTAKDKQRVQAKYSLIN